MTSLLPAIALVLNLGANARAEKPNVIIIYTDDHGYADLSCQGILDDIKTPACSGVNERLLSVWPTPAT